MSTPNEYSLVEKPVIAYLRDELGYTYLRPEEALLLREGDNLVLLRDHLVSALAELNDIAADVAAAIYSDLARQTDNEKWLAVLRGGYSRKISGEKSHRPIHVIDFARPERNRFVVTNQVEIRGLSYRIPDVVVYVNGIPLVVIEAKSAIAKQDVYDAVTDIAVYEKELPRLFQTNLFNIATNGTALRYGATGAPKEFWAAWGDPWPRDAAEFEGEPMRQGLWALLDKARLLDILAHFVVFEKDADSGTTVKKMCRYQQFRAVNKLVDRVADGKVRRGLVWHTQGSGKSLTMVFAALKLKFHHGMSSPELENPNILVVTDRKDLDAQITKTFQDCGIPNPHHAESIGELHELIAGAPKGKVVLSTIFKAFGSSTAVKSSADWIILVDEAHRTQERDLGAYLRATFPDARFFGFTGTPVKTNDLDTRANFGVPGEDYLDRYGIEDAVRDGATVPIRYMSRMALWDLDAPKLDVLFDQEFAALPDELRDELKARGVTKGDLARFEPRISLISYDIWTHFKKNVQPDKMKAQIVAVDRKACTIYKRCLDATIARDLMTQGVPRAEAEARADAMSMCIYSSGGKEDLKPGNEDLARFYVDEAAEKDAKKHFKDPQHPLSFLIVCNKLLTGFDAPVEQAMYLDSYLTEHNLLQAIARINRRHGATKDHGIVVDYIGVTKDLGAALSSYKPDDVKEAAGSDSLLTDRLAETHAAAMAFLAKAERSNDPEKDAKQGVDAIGTEDVWYRFREAAAAFLRALAGVGSNPARLRYRPDSKYVATVLAYGKLAFEQAPELDFKEYSEKIRGMLREHLQVTGLETLLTLPEITDTSFWTSFAQEPDDETELQTAALKKAAALKKELSERAAHSPAQYATLSERIQSLIEQFQSRQITAAELDHENYKVAVAMVRQQLAYERSGLDEATHGFYAILTEDKPPDSQADQPFQFSERAATRLIDTFAEWRHERCDDDATPFRLAHPPDGSLDVARAQLNLFVRVANAPMPAFVTGHVGENAYADLPSRIIEAPGRLIGSDETAKIENSLWAGWVVLGVEPLLFKVMALIEPERTKKLLDKRGGLSTIVTDMQKCGRIPYTLHLSDDAFRSIDGWSARSAYANALRDVVKTRIDHAHKAPKNEPDIWYSAMAVMLGVISHNAAALRDALGRSMAVDEPLVAYGTADGASPGETKLHDVARELERLFTDDATAPLNWHKNPAVERDLKRKSKRVLMRLGTDKAQRDRMLARIVEYAKKRFSRVRS